MSHIRRRRVPGKPWSEIEADLRAGRYVDKTRGVPRLGPAYAKDARRRGLSAAAYDERLRRPRRHGRLWAAVILALTIIVAIAIAVTR